MPDLSDDQRELLLDALAEHTRRNPRPFVAERIVEANRLYFPDVFRRDADSLSAIAARMIGYCGLDGYAVDVTLDVSASDSKAMLPRTRIDFAGVEDRIVFFSCLELGQEKDAVLCLAHEVARAALVAQELGHDGPYRATSRPTGLIAPADTDEERINASVHASYLGLGVLSTQGSHEYRQASRMRGRVPVTEWQHVRYGALDPEETSFLLAVQLVVRAVDAARVERLLAPLSDERRLEVRADMRELDRAELIERLGLPPVGTWPEEVAAAADELEESCELEERAEAE